MFVLPTNWQLHKTNKNHIYLWGKTIDNKLTYHVFEDKITHILSFQGTVTPSMIEEYQKKFDPMKIKAQDNILCIRDPQIEGFENLEENKKVSNPIGSLPAFWEGANIMPYQWLKIESDHIFAVNRNEIVTNKKFFWDIEVLSEDECFPDPERDSIFMISVCLLEGTELKSYVFSSKQVKKDKRAMYIVVENERELLGQFFSLIEKEMPQSMITFNGNIFDIPYVITRARILNVSLPQNRNVHLVTKVKRKRLMGPFGTQEADVWSLPGIEQLDLLFLFRKMSKLPNYKLDTIANIILGKGKSQLAIEEMRSYALGNDPEKMAIIAEYNLNDSLLLVEIWQKLNLDEYITNVANTFFVTKEDLIDQPNCNLVNALAYHLNPCVWFRQEKHSCEHTYIGSTGIYKYVSIYDYSQVYLELMKKSSDKFTLDLANHLENAPPCLIWETFYSRFTRMNDKVILPKVITVDKWELISVASLPEYQLVESWKGYVILTKSTYIAQQLDKSLWKFGYCIITHPGFKLATDLIDQELKTRLGQRKKQANREPSNYQELVLEMKLRDLPYYGLKANIRSQIKMKRIKTWLNAKYLMTKEGPLLLTSFSGDMSQIEIDYYKNKLVECLKIVEELPLR